MGKDKNTEPQSILVLSRKALITSVAVIAILASGVVGFVAFQGAPFTPPVSPAFAPTPQEAGQASLEAKSSSTTPLLALRSSSFHRDEGGFMIAEGQVTNLSDEALREVVVVVNFRADDQLVKSRRALIAFNPLLPGETSPFMVKTTEKPTINVVEFAFEELSGDGISTSDVREISTGLPRTVALGTFKLELQDFAFTVEEVVQQGKAKPFTRGVLRFLVVEGEVANVSSEKLENVVAVATFYSTDEEFVKWAWAPIEIDPILPGQTSAFRVITSEDPAASSAFVEFQKLDAEAIATAYP